MPWLSAAARTSRLAAAGWTVRHSGAPGADQAFYTGAADAAGAVETYLPWSTYEHVALADIACAATTAAHVVGWPSAAAIALAGRFHPAWANLSGGVRLLHARNVHQVSARTSDPRRRCCCAGRLTAA